MSNPANLERMKEYSRALVSALPEASVLLVDRDQTVLLADGKLLERHGYATGSITGRRLPEILPPDHYGPLTDHFYAALAGATQSFDHRTSIGRVCWIQLTPVFFGEAQPVAVISVLQDVTERHHLVSELQAERERRLAAERIAGLGHWELDLETQTIELSRGIVRLLGLEHEPEDLSLESLLGHVDDADRPRVAETLARVAERGEAECECDLHGRDGRRRRVLMRATRSETPDGRPVLAGITIDITRLNAAERARREADALFTQGFDNSPIGMVFLDPFTGRYLRVNEAFCKLVGRAADELGQLTYHDVSHPADVVVQEAARARLVSGDLAHFEFEKRYVRPDGTFVWTSTHVVPVFRAGTGEIRGLFCQLVDLTARKEREEALMREASDLETLDAIRSALAEDRLVLHAQPIVDVASGEVVQQELLVRLRREDGAIVPPSEFLPVAERYAVIREIDQWVTQRAVELAAAGDPVEVNLSAASVGDPEMLATIRDALERTGADPSLVVFEVTETALMADIDRGRRFAAALRELGCRFALDDFGTGYGTFTYLKHIPIDHLKIDIEFVRDLVGNADDERVVRAIVAMARDFGKTTIAEGVEDAATLERLRELGVDHAQGYHIGRPAEIALPVRV